MAALLREFVVPLDLEEEMPVRNAEAALPLFVDQGMVEAAGDTITVPASFWSSGQVPAEPCISAEALSVQIPRKPYALVMEFMRNPLSWFLVHPVAQAKVTDVPRPIQEPHNRAPPDRPPIINMQRNDYRL